MKTRTIDNPLQYDAGELLVSIETSPEAFTSGRRNNDLVNWFLIKRILDLIQFEDTSRSLDELARDYVADWDRLFVRLTPTQQKHIELWRDSGYLVQPFHKIDKFVEYYGKVHDPKQLAYLWLPMDYNVPGLLPENQLILSTEEG